ncbi:MAG: hypothetical protein Q9216_001776 [Gyalolechia sp. 2 TL-2023]
MKRKRSHSLDIALEDITLHTVGPPTPPATQTPLSRTGALPLTTENLLRLPGSPPRQDESESTMSPVKSLPSSKGTSGTAPDIGRALLLLSQHGLHYVGGVPGSLPHEVAEAVTQAMQTSFNEMRSASAEKIIKGLTKNKGRSELTTFFNFWTKLHKESYQKKDPDEVDKFLEAEWIDQGLDVNMDQEFTMSGVSALKWENPADQKLMDAIPDVQIPKPDVCFGIDNTIFTPVERATNTILLEWAWISKHIWHAFALIEYKGDQPIDLAEIQALRGGSTLVEVTRAMWAKAKMLDLEAPGIDASSIIFSFCMTNRFATLYVHWAEVDGDEARHTRYYMSPVREYFCTNHQDLKNLRQDLERILDWGTLNRLNGPKGVREMLKKVHALPPEPPTPKKKGTSSKDQGNSSGKKSTT